VAIVAPGFYPANLAMMLKLRDAVPEMIVLAEGQQEIARLHRSVPGSVIFLKSEESALFTRFSAMTAGTAGKPAPVPSILCLEDCRLDLAGHVFVTADGQEVALTRAESEVLKELAWKPCCVLSREKLRRHAAGRDADPFDRSIDMLVARLRRKIEPDPKVPRFLVTVPGVGYKLMARPLSASKPQSTEPERRQITALCCKLVGAMEFAVKFDPEEVSRVTGTFHEVVVSAITQMGGTIATVTPDHILAFFGYPEAHEDDAERAVSAALDAMTKIRRLPSPTGGPLQLRVGAATGLALASQLQAVGGPSVVAIAVCDLAAPNSVMVTTSTRGLLSSTFVCDRPERYELAEVSEAVSACRVTGRRQVASRFKARHSSKITRLIGRDQELQQLLELWDRAKRGEGQVGLICGEAGIGKSHLCEFLLGLLIEEPHATFRYQCSPHHTNSPFYPIISQLEHAMGFEQADTPALKLEKLEAGLSVEATKKEILLYASLLSIATPQRESPLRFTPQRQKDLTIAALSRHLLKLAEKQPLIIVLADAHWIDPSTLDLVNSVIPLIRTIRVFFVIKFRPEFIPPWLGDPHVTMLTLDRIGREQGRGIISEVVGQRAMAPEVEEQIIDKADGVPLFVEELTKSVLETELAENANDRHVAGRFPLLTVPASLLDSLTARLDRLGPAKEIVQVGSVIGREFSQPLLAVVVRGSAVSLRAALTQLEASELVFPSQQSPDVTYRFKHALLQDAAYATLSRVKRQQIHSLVADSLENGFPLTVETQPELLAHHFAQAGLTERAVDYLLKAGQRSIEHSANLGAIDHLTRALELVQALPDSPQRKRAKFQVEVMLGQAMIAAYGYAAPRTREALLRARTIIDDSTDLTQKFSVLYGIWASHYVAGEMAKQRAAAAEFMAEAERTADIAIQCTAHRIVGTAAVTMGEFATGCSHLRQAWALYDPERHACYRYQYVQDIGAATLCYLSWALWHLGYFDQASEAAAKALKLAEKLSHPHTIAYTICHARGFMDLFRRRSEDMQSYAGVVISICNENGLLHWVNCGNILDGWAAVCAGQVDKGTETLREGLAGWHKGGARLWMPMFLLLEAEAEAKAGRNDTALQVIERAIAICEENGERWAIAEVLRTKARLLQSTRRASSLKIETMLLDSLEIARRQQALCWELRTSCDLSRLWQRRGQGKKALELLQSVYDQFTEGFDTADLRDAQALLRNLRRDLRHRRSKEGGTKQSLVRTV
jgi:predicted ATPase/class 3 adenylate cyclase